MAGQDVEMEIIVDSVDTSPQDIVYSLSGSYFYKSQNKPISLKGQYTISGSARLGNLRFEESFGGQKTEEFSTYSDREKAMLGVNFEMLDKILGNWTNPQKSQKSDFELKKVAIGEYPININKLSTGILQNCYPLFPKNKQENANSIYGFALSKVTQKAYVTVAGGGSCAGAANRP